MLKSFLLLLLFSIPVAARERTPIADDALDGGVLSAETLGRGNTIASNRATPAAGSENPASLADSGVNAAYATALVHVSSELGDDLARAPDPLRGKILQYFSMQGEKGVIYYEPLSRARELQILDPASPSTDFRKVEYDANAFGFAGAERWGAGSIGLSMAYLHSSIASEEHRSGLADQFNYDTADGLRLNIGVRYPTGPAMWGLLVQNAPGMLWSKDYQREILPFKVRVGNTFRLAQGMLLSADWERRFYHEGSHADNYIYVGAEAYISNYAILRGGMFGTDLNKSETRHGTFGLTIIARSGAEISYAMDIFEEDNQRVRRSLVSLQAPFDTSEEDPLRK